MRESKQGRCASTRLATFGVRAGGLHDKATTSLQIAQHEQSIARFLHKMRGCERARQCLEVSTQESGELHGNNADCTV
eukprot:2920844-Pleurochrysis_carterae.AAC.1